MGADYLEDDRHLEVMSYGTCLQVGVVVSLEMPGIKSCLKAALQSK